MSIRIHVPMISDDEAVRWEAIVNGTMQEHLIQSNTILLDALRDSVGTLGVKRGCDMGTCGCCSVMIDGQPRLSCLTLAGEAAGCEITTVEGLSDGHHLHPIQKCFVEAGGSQCGFCTPGFLVVCAAFLAENDDPTDEEIKAAIDGNLCRCTGYQQIVQSVRDAGALLRAGGCGDSTIAQSDPDPGF